MPTFKENTKNLAALLANILQNSVAAVRGSLHLERASGESIVPEVSVVGLDFVVAVSG